MRLLALFSFAFCFFPYGAHAQDLSAADILKKVAENYGRVSSFSVVAEKKVELDTDTSGERYRLADPVPSNVVVVGSHESQDIQVILTVSNSSKARLPLKDGRKEVVVVNDGKVVWTLIPAQHAYTELSARSADKQTPVYILRIGSNDISGVGLLEEYESLVATRFQSISTYEQGTKLEKSEALKVGKSKKGCYVLKMQMPGRTQRQKLWVDKREFTVWKSVDTTLEPQDFWGDRLQTTVTVTTQQMNLNPSLEESNFIFTPPDRAKRVDSLKLSGDNPF